MKKTPKTKAEPKKAGRPSVFNEKIAFLICARLAEGDSLRAICKDPTMPGMATVFRWLADDRYATFREQYEESKKVGLESWAEEIMEIADDGTNDWMEKLDKDGQPIGWQVNGEHVTRSRLRIDSRKWLLSKLVPKKYGDKTVTELTGADGGPVQISDTERAAKIQAIITAAQARKGKDGSGV